MEPNRLCRFCHTKAELICHRCRDPYCSRSCQELDWPEHKLICFPLPSLVKAVSTRNILANVDPNVSIKSAPESQTPSLPSKVVPPVSHLSTNLQSLKIAPGCDMSSKLNNSNGPLRVNNENVANIEQSANVPSVDRNENTEKPTDKKVFKPVDCKWDKVDVTSIRKPGILNQVIRNVEPPKQVTSEPQPKSVTSEPSKQVTSQKQPTSVTSEPSKQVTSQQQTKSVTTEPSKQVTSQREPKNVTVEPPKQETSQQHPKSATMEPKKQVPLEKTIEPPKPVEVVRIPAKGEPKTGPWMKPFPIEENEFVEVIVQHTTPDTTWVSLLKHDTANNTLLRNINKNISFTSQPDPKEITVNSLFFVPFEGIYYRGVVLDHVCSKGTVSVRLIDYGNEFELAIGDLRTPLPAIMDHNAYAFPVNFKKAQTVEIGSQIKIKKEMMKGDVMLVSVEGENAILTMKDIKTVPIPVGSSTKLFCLDFSNIGRGYICASIADNAALKQVDEMIPKITEHCLLSKDGYSPQVDEICLAEFEDGQWYRALTLKVIDSDSFEILFIDYGNVITTNSSTIRKMSDEFMYQCLMNYCYIKDLQLTSKEHVLKMARYFNENQMFEAGSVEKDDGKYVIQVTI